MVAVIKEFQQSVPDTQEAIMRKYPRLTAHLICHSLGYFSPQSAANAILSYRTGQNWSCEWYAHMAQWGNEPEYWDRIRRINKETIHLAFAARHGHHGYMAEYKHAIAIVQDTIKTHKGPVFGSWF